MAIVKKIKTGIDHFMKDHHDHWYIGITNDPKYVKKKNGFPIYWRQWETDSLEDAEEIENYYHKKGCIHCQQIFSEKEFDEENRVFVYIY